MTDVRTLLQDLAEDSPTGHGGTTADRVVAEHRQQDRRRLRWAGVAGTVALVVALAPSVLDRTGPSDTAATAVGGAAGAGLYDLPTRGSLAGDEDLIGQALAASWDDGIPLNEVGDVLDPVLDTRFVAFLGEVPGGQVWALVLGRTGTQLAYAWFVDVDASDGVDLQLIASPARTFADVPLGLLDTAGGSGSLVVVGAPGDEVGYAPDGSGGPPGGAPVYERLPTEDGVAVARVGTTEGPGGYAGYRVTRDDVVAHEQAPDVFDSTLPLPLAAPVLAVLSDPVYAPLVGSCLTGRGWNVTTRSDGTVGLAFPVAQFLALEFIDDVGTCATEVGYR